MHEDWLGFLQIFNLEFELVQFSLFLFESLLHFSLLIFNLFYQLLPLMHLFLVLFLTLLILILLLFKVLLFLLDPLNLPPNSLNIILQSTNHIFQLLPLSLVPVLEVRNLIFMLILLLSKLLFIHPLQTICCSLTILILILHLLEVCLEIVK